MTIPQNFYSCTFCYKEFLSERELILFFFCSHSCQFKYAFRIIDNVFPNSTKELKFRLTEKLCEVAVK